MRINENWDALPYGLMRLDTVINCEILGLGALCSDLRVQTTLVKQAAYGRCAWESKGYEGVPEFYRERVRNILSAAEQVAQSFEWSAVQDRVARFKKEFAGDHFSMFGLHQELKALMEAVEDGLKWQLIYRYPADKAKALMSWKDDWAAVLSVFPQADDDIKATVDLWAMNHATASVFHAMRVLECGLHGLAAELKLTFSIQVWHNIINEIESAIKKEANALPRGDARNRRLQFLSEAAKEFGYFKDGWRNYVSHNKCSYDEHQARSVMEHVRQFMTTLAANLSADALAESGQPHSQMLENPHLHEAPERPQ